MIKHSFEFYCIAFFCIILIRYFLVAGGSYIIFYSPLSHRFIRPTLPDRLPSLRSIQQDIQLSVLSTSIFALSAALIMSGYGNGMTRLYSDPGQYGWWYLGVSY